MGETNPMWWLTQYLWGNYALTIVTKTKAEGVEKIQKALRDSQRSGEVFDIEEDLLVQTAIDDQSVTWL